MDPQTVQMLFYYGSKLFWLFLAYRALKSVCGLLSAKKAQANAEANLTRRQPITK